jgi:hypothetical protein
VNRLSGDLAWRGRGPRAGTTGAAPGRARRPGRTLAGYRSLQLGFADFRAARREVGPYSAFYAYRVLEDIGIHFGATKEEKPDWPAMNAALVTDRGHWQTLIDAGIGACHLKASKLPTAVASDPGSRLRLARKAVERTMKRTGAGVAA